MVNIYSNDIGDTMQKQLLDNLILRSISEGHASDRANLPQFFVETFGEEGDFAAPYLGHWTSDLLSGHPIVTHDDIWVVVDPEKDDKIVSALIHIPQMWQYAGIEFPVGRIELVATDTDYRRRGLVRELMNVVHQRSADMGHLVQSIKGIPWFYRQFGYAMAINMDSGVSVPFNAVPALKDGDDPQFTLRPAQEADIPLLMKYDKWLIERSLVATVRTEEIWRYQLTGQHPESIVNGDFHIIQTQSGVPIGVIWLDNKPWSRFIYCYQYVVGEKSSYLETFEDVIRGIEKRMQEKFPESTPSIVVFDGGLHQTLDIIADRTVTAYQREHPYAWYIRVPSLAKLLKHFQPVLEERLRGSGANNFSGKLMVDCSQKLGLMLEFKDGKITTIEDMPTSDKSWNPDAAFPDHFVFNVVFGHRDYFDLRPLFPDAYANRKAAVLLNILFPKQRSWVVGVS